MGALKLKIMNHVEILGKALEIVKSDRAISAIDALNQAAIHSTDDQRKLAVDVFKECLMRSPTGLGVAFQESILESAFALSARRSIEQTAQGENNMTETKSNDTIVSRGKKYTVGEMHELVATLSMQPTETGENTLCKYQLSRKTGRSGVMDVQAKTSVKYVGVREVYKGKASSKRMIFLVPAGTVVRLDGNDVTLAEDLEAAGVANHIDADDGYNTKGKKADVSAG